MVFQSALTIIVPVIPEQADTLRKLLEEIGNINKNNHIEFQKLKTVHFCRWFLIDQAVYIDGKPLPVQLVFTSNYDGKLDDHLDELFNVAENGLNAIYQNCEGFDPLADINSKKKYLLRYQQKESLFWVAKIGGTVDMILKEDILQNYISGFLDQCWKNQDVTKLDRVELFEQVKINVLNNPGLAWALQPAPKPPFQWKFKYYANFILKLLLVILALPLLIPILIIWIIISRFMELKDDRERQIIQKKPVDDVLEYEDRIFQNQLTIYGTIKNPHWFRFSNLRFFLGLFRFNGKYRSTKGKLSGIETIHFARWVLFNKGRHVMFMSNYDGGWESYLNEFIDRSANAMNLTFSNIMGYLKVSWLLKDGAHDEQNFKTVVRNNQYPCPVWYSAYPMLTIKNILRNSKIRNGLSAKMNPETIKEWLTLF